MPVSNSPWEAFAQRDARWYISTDFGHDEATFWKSGEETSAYIWNEICAFGPPPNTILDIGAGIGRVCLPLAPLVSQVIAVDIASTMLAQLRLEAKRRKIDHVHTCLVDEPWEKQKTDAAYCILTFQHMEDIKEIQSILQRVATCLQGVAYLQFDTRAPALLDALKRRLPDNLLPRSSRRGMRRTRRPSHEIRRLLSKLGFVTLHETKPDSELHGFTVKIA